MNKKSGDVCLPENQQYTVCNALYYKMTIVAR